MPRYFFHIADDDDHTPDDEGMLFPNLEAAKLECEANARQLLLQAVMSNREVDNRRIEVSDEYGVVVHMCELRDLVH